ncbi:MAG: radical SAM protein [Candidatus Methanoperedens sp.]|nr:radical SAM protein [Candidatus Methanoperedens sp.]
MMNFRNYILSYRKKNNELLNLNEIENKRINLKSTPRWVIIDPTNICNCRCIICFRNYLETFKPHELSEKNISKLSSFLGKATEVSLMGTGESFLNKNFSSLAKMCKKQGLYTNLSTNGTLLDKNLDVLQYIDALSISFDAGTKDLFERIRRGADFEKVMSNIRLVNTLSKKPFIKFQVTVSKENLNDLPNIIQRANELGIHEVSYAPVYPMGKGYMEHIILVEADSTALRAIENKILQLADKYGIKAVFNIFLDSNLKESELVVPFKDIHCSAPWRMIYIECTGKVRPCCNLEKHMGDLNKDNIKKIWNGKYYQELRASLSGQSQINPFCAKCKDVIRTLK